ncbi:MAG TPA: hypothetical protein VGA77_06725 [Propylenella sp.]
MKKNSRVPVRASQAQRATRLAAGSAKKRRRDSEEERQISQIVGRHPLPPSVREVQYSFGEDSTGNPAVWIVYVVEDDQDPSQRRISELNELATTVRNEILRSDIERWPYVQFRPAA